MYHRNTTPQFITTPTYQVRSYDGIPLIDENEQRRRSIPTTTYGNSPPALDAVKPTLGPQPESGKFYRGNGVALAMKDKVFTLTGDDFIVRMVDGEDVVKCKTKFVGVHRRKKIVDLEGNDVYTLSTKSLGLKNTFRAEGPNDKHAFTLTPQTRSPNSPSTVTFTNASNNTETSLEVIGSWSDKNAEIRLDDQVVASISRRFYDAREFFGEKSTYFVAVAAGVDLSLVVGLCYCLDDREGEGGG